MKIKDLIQQLKKLDEDLYIGIQYFDAETDLYKISSIKKIESISYQHTEYKVIIVAGDIV